MAKLRKFVAYRRLERPFTRRSKYRKKSFVKHGGNNRIVRFNMGDVHGDFDVKFKLMADDAIQIRDNALESARQVVLRRLERTLGKGNFYFHVRVFPHHVLRENPLASGAGADRMSTGMKCSFGKTIGVAAQVRRNQVIFEVSCKKNNAALAKEAIKLAPSKLPCSCRVEME
ncbi:MAG: 50S ribosomal protein L16 [Nanoarchaeota archaeon]